MPAANVSICRRLPPPRLDAIRSNADRLSENYGTSLRARGPLAAPGGRDPQARIYASRDGQWRALDGGLPEPLPAMPYALVATKDRLFAGLADGQLWESNDRGESWHPCPLEGDSPMGLNALVAA
jgi:hypothetical protein